MPTPPYSEPYRSELTGTIAELMQAGARAHANAARQNAEASARAAQIRAQNSSQLAGSLASIISNAGQQIAQPFTPEGRSQRMQLEEQERTVREDKALRELFAKGQPKPEEVYQVVGPKRGADILKGFSALSEQNVKTDTAKMQKIADLTAGVLAWPEAGQAQAYALARQHLISGGFGIKPEDIPEQFDPAFVRQKQQEALTVKERLDAAAREAAAAETARNHRAMEGRPIPVAPGTSLIAPSALQAVPGQAVGQPVTPLYTAPPRPEKRTLEQKNVTLDGKPNQLVNFDPTTGNNYLPGSDTPIESSRLKANVPPSIVIHNEQRATATMPEWALTDARPSGPDANKPDPTIRMTPNGLHQAALNFIATGQYPPTGRGSDPASLAQREAINAKVGAVAAASGMDLPTLRAFYKSNAASLSQQQKAADSVQSFMSTADKNADLLKQTLAKVPDSGIPLLNQPLRSFAKNVEGDKNMSQMVTYLRSAQAEYGRIISQPNLAGQLTDSARHEAQDLLDPKATVQQMLASLDALRSEGTNRVVSIGEQIQRIQQRMQNGPGDQKPQAAPPAPAPAAAAPGGQIIVTAPDGSKHPFATQAQADAFKRLAGIK
jgi:hypothetical protein